MANIGDIFPAILPLALGIVALTAGFGLIKMLTNGIKSLTSSRRYAIALPIALMGLVLLMPVQGSVQAVTIDMPDFNFDGMPSILECEGLAASTKYGVRFDTVNETCFTTAAAETTKNVFLTLDRPSDGVLTIDLVLYSTDAVQDSIDVQLPEMDTFVPIETFIALGIVAILIGVLVYYVNDFKSGRALR